jgi:hypothetical protein
LYIKSKNYCYFSKFKTYRNKLKHLIQVSKKSYYNKYFANNKYNIKNTWKGIKQLITLKHQPYLVPNLLEVENLKLTNSKSIANAFNNYFPLSQRREAPCKGTNPPRGNKSISEV